MLDRQRTHQDAYCASWWDELDKAQDQFGEQGALARELLGRINAAFGGDTEARCARFRKPERVITLPLGMGYNLGDAILRGKFSRVLQLINGYEQLHAKGKKAPWPKRQT